MGSGVNCRQAAAAEVRLRAKNSVENRGAGRTEGTKRTATVLKIVEVLSTINSVGGLQYFVCQWLRNAVSSDLVSNDKDGVLGRNKIPNVLPFLLSLCGIHL